VCGLGRRSDGLSGGDPTHLLVRRPHGYQGGDPSALLVSVGRAFGWRPYPPVGLPPALGFRVETPTPCWYPSVREFRVESLLVSRWTLCLIGWRPYM